MFVNPFLISIFPVFTTIELIKSDINLWSNWIFRFSYHCVRSYLKNPSGTIHKWRHANLDIFRPPPPLSCSNSLCLMPYPPPPKLCDVIYECSLPDCIWMTWWEPCWAPQHWQLALTCPWSPWFPCHLQMCQSGWSLQLLRQLSHLRSCLVAHLAGLTWKRVLMGQ